MHGDDDAASEQETFAVGVVEADSTVTNFTYSIADASSTTDSPLSQFQSTGTLDNTTDCTSVEQPQIGLACEIQLSENATVSITVYRSYRVCLRFFPALSISHSPKITVQQDTCSLSCILSWKKNCVCTFQSRETGVYCIPCSWQTANCAEWRSQIALQSLSSSPQKCTESHSLRLLFFLLSVLLPL